MLAGCNHMPPSNSSFSSGSDRGMTMVEASQTQSVVTLKDVLDAEAGDIPTLTAIGYAVTSSQPGEVRHRNA